MERVQVHPIAGSRRGTMNLETADDANAAATAARLPGDILASVFLRLPASDLRRFRRVCKEWRGIISDPIFLEAHQVQGPRAPTHTIVYFSEQHTGRGFLFDEQWRLTATFAAGETGNLVGTCNGLLCFLDVEQRAINVVEPFTGESLAMPLPPMTARRHKLDAYCFCFDLNTRRYKIIHQGEGLYTDGRQVLLHVYTARGGEKWRSLQVAGVKPGYSYGYGRPVCVGGAVYWWVMGTDAQWKIARFDLATEEVTTRFIQGSEQISLIESGAWTFLKTEDTWLRVLSALFVREGDCLVYRYSGPTVKLPLWRRPTVAQALQRGHLLLEDSVDGGLYAHPIWPYGHDLGAGKLLLKKGNKEEEDELAKNADSKISCNTRGLFVPVLFNQEPAAVVTPPHKNRAMTFGYVPPVSPAPLAHYFGNH